MLNLVRIGEKIKTLRMDNNITQEQLAESMYVSRQAISRWEKGLALPTIDNICELTKIFNTTFDNILCLDEPTTISAQSLFQNANREYVVMEIVKGNITVNLADVFYQFSNVERMFMLQRLKEQMQLDLHHPLVANTSIYDLWHKLTDTEKQFFDMELFKKELLMRNGRM
ncbi:MAG: helix-turn-helix transcriptional regulator [Clostridia bacterium]|nr:helix-turn-helix transcriptional regulator [Clostridia bacterium]